MNILITGSRSAKTFKILKFFADAQIFLADYGEAPVGSSSHHFISLGEKNEDIIAHNLLNRCLDHAIDLLIPLHLFEIEAVSKAILLFSEFDIEVLLPQLPLLEIFTNSALKPTGNLVVVRNGIQFPEPATTDLRGLSGIFYTNEQGEPCRLFTVDL